MFSEDLSVFFGDFSIQAIWTHDGTDKTLKGIFDNGFKQFGFPAEGANIEFLIQSLEIVGMRQGDNMLINGINYKVASLQPNQDGALTVVKLEN